MQQLPTFKRALSTVMSLVGRTSVHPQPIADSATDDPSSHPTRAKPVVPTFSAAQLDAAKRAQRHSMVAYAMQVRFLTSAVFL